MKVQNKKNKAKKTVGVEAEVILHTLEKRLRRLDKRIREEKEAYKPMLHKSRHVRMTYGKKISDRANWFGDRRAELQHAICFIKGNIGEKEYITYLAGDKLDKLLCAI
jgi:hypothetical protein